MEKEKITETVDEKEEEVSEVAEEKIEKTEEELIKTRKTQESLDSWVPQTKVGKLVKEKKLKDIDSIISEYKILEPEIVDSLIQIDSDLLNTGQSKGKFGGGKRRVWRQTQRKTAEGNVPTFSCLAVVGDKNGHVGIGYGRAKETLPAREKSLRKAKLNIFKVGRGCGSFDCSCNNPHSIPFKVEGKCGSVRILFTPAPQGTGLVTGDECKKILKLAGIADIYSQSFGKMRTTLNVAGACIDALKKTNKENKK